MARCRCAREKPHQHIALGGHELRQAHVDSREVEPVRLGPRRAFGLHPGALELALLAGRQPPAPGAANTGPARLCQAYVSSLLSGIVAVMQCAELLLCSTQQEGHAAIMQMISSCATEQFRGMTDVGRHPIPC